MNTLYDGDSPRQISTRYGFATEMIGIPLHITVGAVPSLEEGNIRFLAHELRIAKAAILYADKVRLCSAGASMAATISERANTAAERWEKVQLFLDFFSVVCLGDELREQAKAVLPILEEFVVLSKRNPILLTRRQREKKKFLAPAVDEIFKPFQDEVFAKADAFGIDEINPAVTAGVLEIHQFGSGLADLNRMETLMPEYLELVQDTLLSRDTHPLFDGDTSSLVESGIAEGMLSAGRSAESRGRQTGLVADILGRLPIFDIPMRALLDIRSELNRPLTHFRAEMVKLSADIESAQWDADFPADVQQVVQTNVQPALLEIDDRLKSLEFAEFWTTRIVDKWGAAAGLIGGSAAGFGAALGQTAAIFAALAGAAVFTGAGSMERAKQRMEVEKNGLYFYHRLAEITGP